MRLSPSGRRLVYVAGKGERPSRPTVTVVLEDGTAHAIAPGHDPRWLNERTIVFCPQVDGVVQIAYEDTGWRAEPTAMPAGNSLTAAAGRFAAHRTDPRRIFTSWRGVISQATDPVISDDGEWLAYLLPDSPREPITTLIVERADGEGEPRILWTGAPVKPRFGGRSLVWETGGGTIAGIADVGNPSAHVVAFPLAGWRAFEPVPVWVPSRGELDVLFLADDGQRSRINLATWGSLDNGQPFGEEIGMSWESGYEHDARADRGDIVACWLDPTGKLDGLNVLEGSARVALHPPARPTPSPVGTPVTAPKALAYWFDFGRYGTFSPKRNATVIGSGMFADGNGNLPGDITAQLSRAVSNAGRAFLAATDIGASGINWANVFGVFVHEPGSPDQARLAVKLARALLTQNQRPTRPVIAVLTPEAIGNPAYAGTADALAIEIYLDRPEETFETQYSVTLARIAEAVGAVVPTPVYLVVQAYDRGSDAWRARPDLLEAVQAAANRSLLDDRVLGLWWFAYGRPGGVVTYPQLEAWHAAQVAVTPAPPLPAPPKPPAPTPVPPKPENPMKSREQFYAEFGQVNAFYEAQDGLKRPGGMVIDSATPVRADSEAMAAWGYDLMSGATPQECIARIRQSGEWQQKHASDPR